jgi:hypothetical protein
VKSWQRELVGRIVDQVDEYTAGRRALHKLAEGTRGVFDAADVSDNEIRVWAPVSGQLELRTEDWSKPEWVSDEELAAAWLSFARGPPTCQAAAPSRRSRNIR